MLLAKMIVKGVAFNPKSPRHMKVLGWAMSQSKNFSNYLRDLVILDFERNHLKGAPFHSEQVIRDGKVDVNKKII